MGDPGISGDNEAVCECPGDGVGPAGAARGRQELVGGLGDVEGTVYATPVEVFREIRRFQVLLGRSSDHVARSRLRYLSVAAARYGGEDGEGAESEL